ncbi:hypothetical protein KL918_000142 [Ogataea parapolymorpha]|uniref:Transporter AQR1 n=1 Tax=Ogataea parapolymorpha (strain ATCC 26012 / BCRC 20466 / JCM 22074 / NRRL Y-7560 / DL-1) TaxID=871575 RepID=W1Q781_OGAPD|nr:transporter AQR1 [Ogataea parapolymorpha DL-1]ESW96194.1 transporter AQR1 [Ogataea parapolymorpha DL-1]KAG7869938.1 hypothetical protein KL918_000142 [Ogataea parapolymorpha]KAG7873226.1 hypothetical protein KL916_002527 [Ogataea parapolymorpha]
MTPDPKTDNLPDQGPQEVPHTILTKREKSFMTFLLSLIGVASAMSMPIYWVALTEMKKKFGVTEEQINLTVVAYLILQSLSPVFFSTATDYVGRRPVVLVCLLGGLVINIALAVSDAYWMIILFRCLLASFVSPLISIDSSIVSDFTTRRDRGGYNGTVNGFLLVGQGFSPFFGALVDSGWDWRAIFYFCAIIDGVLLLIAFICLPETKRTIVGNMSVKPDRWYHRAPILLYFGKRLSDTSKSTLEHINLPSYNPLRTVLIVRHPQVAMVLIPSSVIFATWTISQASLSTELSESYGYSTLKIGICFFAPGVATILGAIISGKVLDLTYNNLRQKQLRSDCSKPLNIIKARLQYFLIPSFVCAAASVVFGWCFQKKESVAIILVMSFLITFSTMFPMNAVPTLLIDMFPGQSGSVASLNNLGRCGVATIFMACLSKMGMSLKLGGTYTLMAGLIMLGNISVYALLARSSRILADVERRKRELDN